MVKTPKEKPQDKVEQFVPADGRENKLQSYVGCVIIKHNTQT